MSALFRKPQWKFKLSPISQWKFKVFPSSKLGRLYFLSAFFTILSITLTLVFATRVYTIEDVSYDVPLEGNATTKIVLVTHYIDVDATAGTMTTDWYPLSDSCDSPEEVVNIYFDRNLLISPTNDANDTPSDRPPEQPVFQFNTKSRCRANIRDSMGTFRIVAKLIGQSTRSKWTGPSLQWYPFDIYLAQFSLFAQLNSTKASVGMITNAPFGSPVNFKVNVDQDKSVNTDEGLYLHLDIRRSGAVRLLVILIVMANWLASIAFLWITIASLLWPENVVKELFVIPIASLFAFTSVRSNMPGAPAGFGAFMDFVGILPNLASMAIFSAVLLFVILLRRTRTGIQGTDGESVYAHRVDREEGLKRVSSPARPLVPEKEMSPMSDTQPALSEVSHIAANNGEDTKHISPEQNEKESSSEIDNILPALLEVGANNSDDVNRVSLEKNQQV